MVLVLSPLDVHEARPNAAPRLKREMLERIKDGERMLQYGCMRFLIRWHCLDLKASLRIGYCIQIDNIDWTKVSPKNKDLRFIHHQSWFGRSDLYVVDGSSSA